MHHCEIAVMGAGIIDIPVIYADRSVFSRHSTPVDHIGMTTGGDALNEATVLARLGHRVRLISRWGCDAAGDYLDGHCARLGIDTQYVHHEEGLDTGVNVVLVDEADGARRFYNNRHGSLRRLLPSDFSAAQLEGIRILSLASIFVFPLISIEDFARIAHTAREHGVLVCADFVLPKKGENLRDLAPLLRELDYVFANEVEAEAITGESTPDNMADALLSAGARHVIIKLGADGCRIAKEGFCAHIPACPGTRCVDTTGAGDNFAAGFHHALLAGKSFSDCAYFANACASVSVECVGASTGVTSLAQVEERLAHYTK
ncbi:MAG: carbohydrate kinase family protein [Eubacteriales bacterium]|nr:carbohydrate kinase family protein [Eubacteriales bacterium]